MITIEQEFHCIASLPYAADSQVQMTVELAKYKSLADSETILQGDEVQIGLWEFWIKHQLDIPSLFLGALEAALIMPSSGTAERVFSLLNQGFSNNQCRALEDYKESSVMLRYNDNFRMKE